MLLKSFIYLTIIKIIFMWTFPIFANNEIQKAQITTSPEVGSKSQIN